MTGFVLPMYMGVIHNYNKSYLARNGAPHVYGGDPTRMTLPR